MDESLISVIVPVHNVKNYLEKCVNSILNQTYKNLEVILVDDGSTDGSSELCEDLKEKDTRVIVVHQNNQGVSAARNAGIKVSKGKYIGFIDSDDYIEDCMFSILYNNAITTGSDISICGYNVVKENYIDNSKVYSENKKPIMVSEDIDLFYKMANRDFKGFMCNKLFSKNTIKNVEFDDNIKLCEDLLVIIALGKNMRKFCYDDTCLYNYVMRKNSAIHNRDFDKFYTAIIAYRKIIGIMKENQSRYIDFYILDKFKWENGIMRGCKKYKAMLRNETRADYKVIMKSNNLKTIEKFESFIRYRMNFIYELIKNMKNMTQK